MNNEIKDDSGQLIGRLSEIERARQTAKLAPSKNRSAFKKWIAGTLTAQAGQVKYKQVSAKGYRLK